MKPTITSKTPDTAAAYQPSREIQRVIETGERNRKALDRYRQRQARHERDRKQRRVAQLMHGWLSRRPSHHAAT